VIISTQLMTLSFSFLLLGSIAFADVSPDEIVNKADHGRMPAVSLSFLATVKDYQKSDEPKETRYQVYSKGPDASLVKTIFPERQQGRKLLMEGDNLWLYTPDVKRAARVSMQQRLSGEIANGDLARTNYAVDYTATLVDSEKVNGTDAYHLNLKAKHAGVTYSRLEYWVSKKDFLPMKAIFYAVSGKLLKTAVYSDPKTVLGSRCVTKFTVKDALNPGHTSVLIYSGHKKMNIPDSMLSKESLSE
jgi:outer membrane lipoprotein-sorting protein